MLPGDKPREKFLSSMIRVNHAGEFGAKRIYQGQLNRIKDEDILKTIMHMKKQEEAHLEYFSEQLIARRIRPTLLMPIWNIYGYLLGTLTAHLSNEAAMACTEAVEEVINDHYLEQIKALKNYNEEELSNKIESFRQEELEHRDIALMHNSTKAKGHKLLSTLIKSTCKIAIKLSKRF
jgi:ubiquinone biosynthesis monooxygenase Coq7